MYDANYYNDIVSTLSDECKKLVSHLVTTKFFIDPASNKYHHVYGGGLAQHSMEFYHALCKFVDEDELLSYDRSTLFLISIGHDLDKVGRYRSKYNNYAYIPRKRLAQYHGGNSFALLESILGDEFKNHKDYAIIHLCIFTHMGEYGENYPRSEYFKYCIDVPLVRYTYMSDLKSCEIDGARIKCQ